MCSYASQKAGFFEFDPGLPVVGLSHDLAVDFVCKMAPLSIVAFAFQLQGVKARSLGVEE